MSKKKMWHYSGLPKDVDGETYLIYFRVRIGDETKDEYPYIYHVRTRDYNRHDKTWRIHGLEQVLEMHNFARMAVNNLGFSFPEITEDDVRIIRWAEVPWPGGDQDNAD